MGVDFRRMAVNNPYYSNNSGAYGFSSSSPFSTGDGGLDFMLGIPNSYGQFSGGHIIVRAYEYYFYAQDSYKATPALTLNGGIGYQIDTPLNNFQFGGIGVNCFSLENMNQQSVIYPTAPPGTLFPGDPNCTQLAAIASTMGTSDRARALPGLPTSARSPPGTARSSPSAVAPAFTSTAPRKREPSRT